jgi:hypothetical protein
MEDKIRKLCEGLVMESDPEKCLQMGIELRESLHSYVEKLRTKVAEYPSVNERRSGSFVVPVPDSVEGLTS